MLETLLKELFLLNEKETQVYIALVNNPGSTASRIAKAINLPRNTARGILEKLVETGIVYRTKNKNSFLYSCEDKTKILSNLETKKETTIEELNLKIKTINKHGDIFGRNQEQNLKPKLFFYDGYSGIKKIYEDTLDSKSTIYSWASFDENSKALPKYFNTYYKRRAKKGIKIRSIHPKTLLAQQHMRTNKMVLREAKLVDSSEFKITPEIQVYDNKVNIVSWKEKVGLIIESKEISEAVKSIFHLCWSGRK